MALTDREKINTVAPALRALLGEGDVLKLVRFDDSPGDEAAPVELVGRTPQEIVAELREALARAGTKIEAVSIASLGAFRVSEPPATSGRVAGKVAVVTGAAQGIGLQIARGLADQGACVVLADINTEGASAAADEICARLGAGRAVGVAIDVTDGDSASAAFDEIVRTFGGLDVLVSNAGVLKAGSVKTQPVEDFEFVTSVNYTGYFVCVQKAAPVMSVQHLARPGWTGDIIQINSKSGLAGSDRNAAYAGGKFGGIGLTQSFALELIEDGIKVNSICPGNFFDGPLWSDPQTGLLVQYLRAGKVPGAETVEDVRRAYEAKVPMGRGCSIEDVIKAIYYLIDQQYETGQALPVTGGQVMLR